MLLTLTSVKWTLISLNFGFLNFHWIKFNKVVYCFDSESLHFTELTTVYQVTIVSLVILGPENLRSNHMKGPETRQMIRVKPSPSHLDTSVSWDPGLSGLSSNSLLLKKKKT